MPVKETGVFHESAKETKPSGKSFAANPVVGGAVIFVDVVPTTSPGVDGAPAGLGTPKVENFEKPVCVTACVIINHEDHVPPVESLKGPGELTKGTDTSMSYVLECT